MARCKVIVLSGEGKLSDELVTAHPYLRFETAEKGVELDLLLDDRTLFITDDPASLSRLAGQESMTLAGVALVDPGLDPADFGLDPLLVTFLPVDSPAETIRAVLFATCRRLGRYFSVYERLARDEVEISRHHEESKRFLVEFMGRNERLRRLEENSTDWIWEIDRDLCFTYSSPRGGEILGVCEAEIIGRNFASFLPGDEQGIGKRDEVIKKMFDRQERFSSREFVFTRDDGGLVYLETSGVPLFSSSGTFNGYLGVARDVSSLKRESARLARSNSIQKMVNSVLETVIADTPYHEQLGHVLDVALSLSFPRMLPKGSIFTVENGDEVLTLQVQRGFSEEQLRACSRVPFGTCVCGHTARDGVLHAAECDDEIHEFQFAGAAPHSHYCVPVISRGRVIGVLNIYMAKGLRKDPEEEDFLFALANCLAVIIERHRRDEERERILARMAHSRRLDAISRLAGGLAHDFNNILTGISGYAMLTMLAMEEGDPKRKNLEAIGESCRRAAELVRQLATFGRQEEVKLEEVHLGGFLQKEEKKIRQVMGAGVGVKIESEPELWLTTVDHDLIENIIFNLAQNSRDAMAGTGELRLSCRNQTVTSEQPVRPGLAPGDYMLFSISDNGCGIDPEIVDLVFEPFFSTSEEPGRGLGLATVYGAMKRLGGNIFIESVPGEGTTFHLYFPRSGGGERPVSSLSGEVTARGERILLVEDDDLVRSYVKRVLNDLGYQVTECATGGEAVAAGADFDLLLADVILPDINGIEVSRELVAKNPALATLFMSGFMESIERYDDILIPGRNFIGKPIMPAVLASRVRRMLDDRAIS